jgi:hypothetical protein
MIRLVAQSSFASQQNGDIRDRKEEGQKEKKEGNKGRGRKKEIQCTQQTVFLILLARRLQFRVQSAEKRGSCDSLYGHYVIAFIYRDSLCLSYVNFCIVIRLTEIDVGRFSRINITAKLANLIGINLNHWKQRFGTGTWMWEMNL